MPESTSDLRHIPVADVAADPEFNPRAEIDVEDIKSSVEKYGILQPLTVERENGNYRLVAGERRLTAAMLIGLKTVPCLVRESTTDKPDAERLAVAVIENIKRRDLTVVEEARAAARLRALGYSSRRQVAAALSVSEQRVKLYEQIVACPESVQDSIHDGTLPAGIAPVVAPIADVSPTLAEHIGRAALTARVSLEVFADTWPSYLVGSYRDEIEGEEGNAPEFYLAGTGYDPHEFDLDDATDAKVAELDALYPWGYGVEFNEKDVDAARAYGCLLEHKPSGDGYNRSWSIITDVEWAKDRAVSTVIPRDLRKARKSAAEIAKQRADTPDPGPDSGTGNESIANEAQRRNVDEDTVREERAKAREEDAELRAGAEQFNHDLGIQLFDRLNAVELSNEVADMIVALILRDDAGDWARRGLAYLHPAWKTEDELKNGKVKVSYVETQEEARKRVSEFVSQASTPQERLARVCQVVVATHYADNRCVAKSRRVGTTPRPAQDAIDNAQDAINAGVEKLAKQLTPRMRSAANDRRAERQKEGAWNA